MTAKRPVRMPSLRSLMPIENSMALRLLVIRILGAGASFLVGLYIARQYGAETSGAYYLFLAITTAGAMLSRLGLDGALTKSFSKALSNQKRAQANSIWLYCSGITILLALTISAGIGIWGERILAGTLGTEASSFKICLMLCVPFMALQNINFGALRCLHCQTTAVVLETVLTPAITITLLVFELIKPLGSAGLHVVSAFVIACAITSSTAAVAVARKLSWSDGIGGVPQRAMWRVAQNLLLISLIGHLTESVSTYVLTAYATLEQVGIFNLCLRLVILTGLAVSVTDGINAPKFAVLFEQGKLREIEFLASKAMAFNLLFGAGPLLFMFAFPSWTLSLFGQGFVPGATALRILALGQLGMLACGSVGYLLLMAGRERAVLRSWICSLALQVFVIGLTLQEYGAEAAALAWTAALLLRNAFAVKVSAREVGVRLRLFAWLRD
jgi:O-antigen/teichoic acid export membrane protein